MALFVKKPIKVEAITFEELVAHGIESGGNIVNGMPWSFEYKGCQFTHENDDTYLFRSIAGLLSFHRGEMLVIGDKGGLFPCEMESFSSIYDPVPE